MIVNTSHFCFACGQGIPFGLQRCYHDMCGVWIYWEKGDSKKDIAVKRETPITFPQRAEAVVLLDVRAEPKFDAPLLDPVQEGHHFVVVGCVGDWFHLENGGFAHYSQVAIFGRLHTVRVCSPAGNGTLVPVLEKPYWGSSSDHARVVYEFQAGGEVCIWELQPGWIRINTGPDGHWLPKKFVHKKDWDKIQL